MPDRLYPAQNAFLALRTDGNPMRTIEAIRAEVRALDPKQSVTDINTMDDLLERSTGQQHLTARVLGAFAAIALALALIGLYGVLSYSVTQTASLFSVFPLRSCSSRSWQAWHRYGERRASIPP